MMAFLGINSALAADMSFIKDDKKPSITLVQTSGNLQKTIVFEYDTFRDLQTFDAAILKDLFYYEDEDCTVTATVTVSTTTDMKGDVGVASTGHATTISISATVTASCSEIGSAVKKVIAELRKALGL